MFSVKNVLKVVKHPVTNLLQMLDVPASDISKIEIQWKNITLLQRKTTSDTPRFWAEVSNFKDAAGENPFFDLAKVARAVLTIPPF